METLEEQAQWDIVINAESIGAMVVTFIVAALSFSAGANGGFFWIALFTSFFAFTIPAAAAISQACIALGAIGALIWAVPQKHPSHPELPLISYQLAIIIAPPVMEGVVTGVLINPIVPEIIIASILLVFLCMLATRQFYNAQQMRRHETFKKTTQMMISMIHVPDVENKGSDTLSTDIDSAREVAPSQDGDGNTETEKPCYYPWKHIITLLFLWIIFLIFQLLKSWQNTCSWQFWLLFISQILASAAIEILFVWRLRRDAAEPRCPGLARLKSWTLLRLVGFLLLVYCIGVLVGLLGLGAGLILTPLLLELGINPLVCGSTAMVTVLMSSGTAAVTSLLDGTLNIEYSAIYGSICLIAAAFGLLIVSRLVKKYDMASMVVFLLGGVMVAGVFMTIAFSGRRAVEQIIDTGGIQSTDFCRG